MSFKTRNLYYLRISVQSVLPVYLYLDERHLDWMSDQVLQHVLSDLRPRILPKLLAESGVFSSPVAFKKAVVDTHRGESYQFCYFLRRTEPHSVAIKTRNYIAKPQLPAQSVTRTPATNASASTATTSRRASQKKRKIRSTSTPVNSPPSQSVKKQKRGKTLELDESENQASSEAERSRVRVTDVIDIDQVEEMTDANAEENVQDDDDTCEPGPDNFDLLVDEEEEKPKPALRLKYQGFGIYGQCLCIVVEPWPAIRSTTRTLQEIGGLSNRNSKEKQASVPTVAARAKSPLFLVDDNDVDRDVQAQRPNPVTNFWDDLEITDDSDNDSEMRGMMAFSQALNMAGDSRPGAVEDDDEMEGVVLFGDADEARQL
ncbi:hypothetical protein AN958_10287 [Leucoagaricus sp. SymC.cos]|nr:hypothetical protein AN958_10287 [Leucoagaricus sp. SymC.cos]